jgi:hypothetical protein
MTRSNYTLLFLLGGCLLLSLSYCPPYDLMLDDKEIFKYTGMSILRGKVPYRDFFDHKPPMIYFINAAGMLLGSWGMWIINTALAMLSTVCLFKLSRVYRLSLPWLLPLLFNLLIRDPLILQGINMTREFTAYFTVFFFCILLGKNKYRYFILGFLSALIFFTQQDQVLQLMPLLFYFLVTERKFLLSRILQLGAGFLSFTVFLLAYFAVNHSLGYFWEDAFHFNFSVYTTQRKSFGDHLRTVKRILDNGNYEFPFMITVILGIGSLFFQHKRKGLVIAALAALILAMSPEFMGGRWDGHGVPGDFIYYFLPLSTGICMVLFAVFAFSEDVILTGWKAQLPYALLLCSSLFYTALQHGTHLSRRDDDPVMNAPELPWLRQQQPGDYQLYVFYNNQYIYFYNELKILAPSRWIYHHFWGHFQQWDPGHQLLDSIGQDLIRHRTTYVLMDAATINEFLNPANRDWWLTFIQTHYQPVAVPGRNGPPLLWKWKDQPQKSN